MKVQLLQIPQHMPVGPQWWLHMHDPTVAAYQPQQLLSHGASYLICVSAVACAAVLGKSASESWVSSRLIISLFEPT